jgi:NAD(P)-dependent dehydrogenase (short-subunit alcohol dehydrogenase family)
VSSSRPPASVLITGASTGIGRACAQALDANGWRVFAGVRREEDGRALAEGASDRLEPVTLDVTDEASISAALERVGGASPEGLAGLVNNAGIAVTGPLEFLPLERVRRQLEVNLIGQLAVTQAALEPLRRARGRIVNMSSVGGRTALPFVGPYAASKYALEALSDSLRRELRRWSVDVVLIEPGAIATPIWDKGDSEAAALRDQLPPRAHELYGSSLDRLQRLARERGEGGLPPERVAATVLRALTARRPRARYVIGREARMQILLLGLLPDRAGDRFLARVMGV